MRFYLDFKNLNFSENVLIPASEVQSFEFVGKMRVKKRLHKIDLICYQNFLQCPKEKSK